jgi:shikimate dehydrogenase
MGLSYAEVIGDPVAQTKSPLIHRHWLDQLGLEGDYRATLVHPDELPAFLAMRREDPDWRGCNVTIPHKQGVMALLDRIEPGALSIGAVNCVAPEGAGLAGRNTDIDGVAAALDGARVEAAKAVVIGAGGGARAAVRYFLERGAGSIAILVRDPNKAEPLRQGSEGSRIDIYGMETPEEALDGAVAIVNASPLGMAGSPAMPDRLLAAVAANADGAALLDMVYKPLDTPFLAAGRESGGVAVDGLVMLVGQARAAFELFFGVAPPPTDERLRGLIAT